MEGGGIGRRHHRRGISAGLTFRSDFSVVLHNYCPSARDYFCIFTDQRLILGCIHNKSTSRTNSRPDHTPFFIFLSRKLCHRFCGAILARIVHVLHINDTTCRFLCRGLQHSIAPVVVITCTSPGQGAITPLSSLFPLPFLLPSSHPLLIRLRLCIYQFQPLWKIYNKRAAGLGGNDKRRRDNLDFLFPD